MLKQYTKSESGAFAMYAGVILMLVILGIGVALDAGRATKLRANLQDIADTAVLAAAKSRVKEQSAMQLLADASIAENDKTGLSPSGSLTLSADKKVLSIDMSGTYNTALMKIFGKTTMPINVTAETLIEVTNFTDIVLVLDTTGSMGVGSRMSALKQATAKFVDVIDDIDSDRIRISVVPFAQYVNVGLNNRNQPWIDVPADYTEYFPDQCSSSSPVTGQTNCRMESYPATSGTRGTPPTYGTCYTDGAPYSCQTSSGTQSTSARPGGSHQVCDNTYGPPQTTCSPVAPVRHEWHGCVGSRSGNDNLKPAYRDGESKVPGFLDLQCGPAVLPMTTNLNSARAKVTSMVPNGETYGAAGLIWGWRMLNSEQPFADTRTLPAGTKLKKVAIFMTDGHNTASRTGQTHQGTSRGDADNTAEETCELMKDEKIDIYSITFQVTDNSAKRLVRDCATNFDQYYDADSGASLGQAFEDIGYNLLSPRLTN